MGGLVGKPVPPGSLDSGLTTESYESLDRAFRPYTTRGTEARASVPLVFLTGAVGGLRPAHDNMPRGLNAPPLGR